MVAGPATACALQIAPGKVGQPPHRWEPIPLQFTHLLCRVDDGDDLLLFACAMEGEAPHARVPVPAGTSSAAGEFGVDDGTECPEIMLVGELRWLLPVDPASRHRAERIFEVTNRSS